MKRPSFRDPRLAIGIAVGLGLALALSISAMYLSKGPTSEPGSADFADDSSGNPYSRFSRRYIRQPAAAPSGSGSSPSNSGNSASAGQAQANSDSNGDGTLDGLFRSSRLPWQVDYSSPGSQFRSWPKTLRGGALALSGESDEERANQLIQSYAEGTFGIHPSRLKHQITQQGDQTYVIYEQTEHQLPVIGARIVVVLENHEIIRVMNDLSPGESEAPVPAQQISPEDAEALALAAAHSYQGDGSVEVTRAPSLAYLPTSPRSDGPLSLVYAVEVRKARTTASKDSTRQLQVLVDAKSGKVIRIRDLIRS